MAILNSMFPTSCAWRTRLAGVLLLLVFAPGCAATRLSDTSRTGVEQLLISNAIDQSLDRIDFRHLRGAAVFVDPKYLECTDKNYVVGAIRQRVFQTGCRVVDKADGADVVLEVHSGGVGTDRSEGFVGMPAFNMPGPIPLQLPEVKLVSQTNQFATAKIGIVAYDAKTKQALAPGGITRSRSDSRNWFVLGVGPFNTGALRSEIAVADAPLDDAARIALIAPGPSQRTVDIPAAGPLAVPVSGANSPPIGLPQFNAPAAPQYPSHPSGKR